MGWGMRVTLERGMGEKLGRFWRSLLGSLGVSVWREAILEGGGLYYGIGFLIFLFVLYFYKDIYVYLGVYWILVSLKFIF